MEEKKLKPYEDPTSYMRYVELPKLIHEIILKTCGYDYDYKNTLDFIIKEIKGIVDAELATAPTYFKKLTGR